MKLSNSIYTIFIAGECDFPITLDCTQQWAVDLTRALLHTAIANRHDIVLRSKEQVYLEAVDNRNDAAEKLLKLATRTARPMYHPQLFNLIAEAIDDNV